MDQILHEKIRIKLKDFLKREPNEAEIINGQTDSILMGWIRDDDHAQIQAKMEAVETKVAAVSIKVDDVEKKADNKIIN